MGRGPARPIRFSEDEPRPGPAHHIFKKSRPGPARLIIFQKSGPAHHMAARPMKHGLYMGRPDNYVGRPDNYVGRPVNLTGPSMGRPMCCPVLKGACAYADVFF